MKNYFFALSILVFSSSFSVKADTDHERAQELPLEIMQKCATADNFWVCVENQKMMY